MVQALLITRGWLGEFIMENENLLIESQNGVDDVQKTTYTKRMVSALLIIGIIDLQLTYLLSFLGRDSAQELSIAIVTYILGVAITYMVKSYFGKKEEEKTRLEEKELDFNLGTVAEKEVDDVEVFG